MPEGASLDFLQIAKVTATVLGGLGVLWGAWAKLWVQRLKPYFKKKNNISEFERSMRVSRAIRNCAEEFRIKFDAQRCIVLSARDTGRPFPPNAPIYISCVDQTVRQENENTWEKWQEWECDAEYRLMLHEMYKNGQRGIMLITDNMRPGRLKEAYEKQGTVASVVFFCHWLHSENVMTYTSLNFGEPPNTVDNVPEPLSEEAKKFWLEKAKNLFRSPESIREMAIQMERSMEDL